MRMRQGIAMAIALLMATSAVIYFGTVLILAILRQRP
jgi:hypothetical protein